MKFAFLIFKYFPFGGVQRDMLRIARALVNKGHAVDIYTMSWEGELTSDAHVHLINVQGVMNHRRYDDFVSKAQQMIAERDYDLIVGFNKMPRLEAYFAADSCFIEKAYKSRSWLYRLSGRCRWFMKSERAVFEQESDCHILLLSAREKAIFQHWYRTADERFHVLPPYISAQRMVLHDKNHMRQKIRSELDLPQESRIMLLVGSGFRTKGLDRAIVALASLPEAIRSNTYLVAVGQDNAKMFHGLVSKLDLEGHVIILPGRDDIPQLMQGADLLVHPARMELAGHVLLEAMASSLPVLATDVCGYARHIQQADGGMLLATPFRQGDLNASMMAMLTSDRLTQWGDNGFKYAAAIMATNSGDAEAEILTQLVESKLQARGTSA